MVTRRSVTNTFNDSRTSNSTERVISGLDGESYSVRTTSNEQSTRSDGITGNNSGETEGVPKFTRPDSLEDFLANTKESAKKRFGPPSKDAVSYKNTPGINPKTCGNIVAGICDAVSFFLTRSPALGLNDKEETEMGEALYETISNFPATAMSVKAVNYLAPWAGLIHCGSRIIWTRVAFISNIKAQQKRTQVDRSPFPNQQQEIYAPNPAQAN